MITLTDKRATLSTWLADGSNEYWDFSFNGGYLATSHVKAFTRSPGGVRTEVVVTDSSFVGPYRLRILPAVTNGHSLTIYRDTRNAGLPLVDFIDGAEFSENNLDTVAKQSVFAAAEASDTYGVITLGDVSALAVSAAASAGAAEAAASLAATVSPAIEAAASSASASASAAAVSAIAAAASAASAASAIAAGASVMLYNSTTATPAGSVSAKLRESVSVADFGIYPDGVTNWEAVNPGGKWVDMLNASLTKTVRWPTGYYATGINMGSEYSGAHFHFDDGAVLGGVFHLISDSFPTTAVISSIARAANVVTVGTATPHGYSTGQRIRIGNVVNFGVGSVGFNTDDVVLTSTGANSFTYPQVGPNESGTVTSGAFVSQRPVKDVVITGRLTTTDRLGTINAKDCYIERCWVKSDPTKHSGYPGTTCRGAHIYVGTDNLTMEELIIDDADGANTDAALAIDGNGWNPTGLRIGYCWIKDSACHGAYITGGGHEFGELRISGFARGVYTGTLQDSNGAVQSQQVKGLWINRAWDTHIGVLRTSQVISGSRGYDAYHAVVDETGHDYFGKGQNGVAIDTWLAENVRRGGISFGDPVDSIRHNSSVGVMEVSLSPEGVYTYAVSCLGASGAAHVSIDTLRFIGLGANNGLYVETTCGFSARRVEAKGYSNRLLHTRGRVVIEDIDGTFTGASSALPSVHLANPSVAGSSIGTIRLSGVGVTTRAMQSDNGAADFDIGKLRVTGLANATATMYLDGTTGGRFHAFDMVGDTSGVGVLFNGAVGDLYFGPGVVKTFAKSFAKGTATFTRCTGIGLNGNGSTTATDLVGGSFVMTGCNGLTL